MRRILTIILLCVFQLTISCKDADKKKKEMPETTDTWEVDFIDNFESFNADNWQDQRIWVNNENHCYVPDGKYGTREVSDGTLKLKVVGWDSMNPTSI